MESYNESNGSMTDRRKQSLVCMSEGKSEKEEAKELGCSHHTVHEHRKFIRVYFNAKTQAEAIYKAMKAGVLHSIAIIITALNFIAIHAHAAHQYVINHFQTLPYVCLLILVGYADFVSEDFYRRFWCNQRIVKCSKAKQSKGIVDTNLLYFA